MECYCSSRLKITTIFSSNYLSFYLESLWLILSGIFLIYLSCLSEWSRGWLWHPVMAASFLLWSHSSMTLKPCRPHKLTLTEPGCNIYILFFTIPLFQRLDIFYWIKLSFQNQKIPNADLEVLWAEESPSLGLNGFSFDAVLGHMTVLGEGGQVSNNLICSICQYPYICGANTTAMADFKLPMCS